MPEDMYRPVLRIGLMHKCATQEPIPRRFGAGYQHYFSLFQSISFTELNHSSLRILRTIESRRPPSRLGMLLRSTPSTLQPILFIAAMLLALLLSARTQRVPYEDLQNAKDSKRYLQCLLRPDPGNLSHTTCTQAAMFWKENWYHRTLYCRRMRWPVYQTR